MFKESLKDFSEWLDSSPIKRTQIDIGNTGWAVELDGTLLIYPLHVLSISKILNT